MAEEKLREQGIYTEQFIINSMINIVNDEDMDNITRIYDSAENALRGWRDNGLVIDYTSNWNFN